MGYEINSPVKTVYLPIFSEQMTFDEYKEKTGIDLNEIFDINPSDGASFLKPNVNVVLYAGEDAVLLGEYGIKKGQIIKYFYSWDDPNATFHIFTGFNDADGIVATLYVHINSSVSGNSIGLSER